MVGTLPKTAILLTKNDVVVGHYTSYSEMALSLGISVDMDKGIVTFMGKPQLPHYTTKEENCMISGNHFKSEIEVIKDWSNRHLKLPRGHMIYRYLVS